MDLFHSPCICSLTGCHILNISSSNSRVNCRSFWCEWGHHSSTSRKVWALWSMLSFMTRIENSFGAASSIPCLECTERYQFSNRVDSSTLLKLIVGSKEDPLSSNIRPNNISASAMTSVQLWGVTWVKLGEPGGTATVMFEFSRWSGAGSFGACTFWLSSAVTWFNSADLHKDPPCHWKVSNPIRTFQ